MSGDPEGELAALLPRLIRDSRIHYIDNLRSFLIVLVIFHHAALPFGGIGFWPYVSPNHAPNSSPTLGLFVAVNQTFFMGMLFFLAGHFSSIAADRKSWQVFCAEKLKRLGIPAVVYTLMIHPICLVLVESARHAPIWPALRSYWLHLNGVRGPVWFVAVLLAFDLVYITIRTCLPRVTLLIPSSAEQYRTTAAIGVGTVIVCSFLVRLSHPVGRATPPLGLQLAYAPQYVFAYIAGTCLSKIQQYMLVSHPRRALVLAYLGSIVSICLIGGIAYLTHFDLLLTLGGGNPFAFFYAAWNEISFYFIGTAWYSLFHGSEWTTRRWANTGRYSYGAFLLHPPVLVALQIVADSAMGGTFNGVVKTLLVGTTGVCFSWAAVWVLVGIPGVGKII